MEEANAAIWVRRFWMLLWALAVGLALMLLFATLQPRPFDPVALQHFPRQVLETGRQFSREARLAGTIRNLVGLVAMLWLCFWPSGAGVLHKLERLGRGRLWLGLLFVGGGVTLLLALIDLPLAYWSGYLHEKAYNLTRQSPAEWLASHATGVAIEAGLMSLFWLPLYWLIRKWPRHWWAPAALVNVVFTGLLIVLSPLLLLPMQGKVTDVADPRVLGMIEHLAGQAGVEVESVRQVAVSERTSRVNAMVTGLGPTKQVVFYDTLLHQFSPAEVEVVMAHELSHAIHRDVAVTWVLSGAVDCLVLCSGAWVMRGMVGVGPLRLPAPWAARGLALFMLLSTLTGQVAAPLYNAVSRQMEVRADRFALEMTKNPQAFVRTFKKLASGNPGDVDPPALVELLSHSHPSIVNRIREATGP